ncbi:MAG: hypothetical protein IPK27_08305 [Rhodanobacteraceae bacterium]|nr:hypothetical protein [Rhodanobacteraceae bacterium]
MARELGATASDVTDEPGTLSASLGQPYRSQQFRLRLSAGDPSVYLREIVVPGASDAGATSLQETLTDGRYRYPHQAVNQDAFESPVRSGRRGRG